MGAILEESNLGGNYSSDEMNEGVPLIKMGNVKRGRIRLDELKYIEDEANVEGSDLLTEGDLLLNTRNTPELVGKVALWRGELPKAAFDSNLMRMRFDDAHVYSSAFMNSAFNAHYVIKQLWSYGSRHYQRGSNLQKRRVEGANCPSTACRTTSHCQYPQ